MAGSARKNEVRTFIGFRRPMSVTNIGELIRLISRFGNCFVDEEASGCLIFWPSTSPVTPKHEEYSGTTRQLPVSSRFLCARSSFVPFQQNLLLGIDLAGSSTVWPLFHTSSGVLLQMHPLNLFQVEKAMELRYFLVPLVSITAGFVPYRTQTLGVAVAWARNLQSIFVGDWLPQTPTNSTLKSEHPCPKRLHLPANRRWAASNESFVPESLGGGVSSIEFIRALIIQCHSVQLQYVCSPPIYCSRVFPEVQISDVNEQQHTSNSGRRYCFY